MKINRSGVIFYISVFLTVLIIISLFISVIISRHENDIMSARYKAEKIVSQIFFSLRFSPPEKVISEYKEIVSFGLYTGEGVSVIRYGKAPENIAMIPFDGDKPLFDRKRGVMTIVRPLMPPGMGRMERRNKMSHPNREHNFVLVEIHFSDFNRRDLLYVISSIIVPALLFSLAFFLVLIYRKNERFRIELEKKDEMARLGEASRTLAHEIKNPLGAISIQVGILKKILPEQYKSEVLIIAEETDRIKVISERIGDFLRDPFGFPEVFNVTEYLRSLATKYSHPITIESLTDCASVFFDQQRFRSVIENLLQNSLDSLNSVQSDSQVIIRIDSKEKSVVITIIDSGCGLSDETSRIFEPFFTTKTNGSGIGLSIVKRFVEAAGGSISLRNNIQGVEAMIILPEVV